MADIVGNQNQPDLFDNLQLHMGPEPENIDAQYTLKLDKLPPVPEDDDGLFNDDFNSFLLPNSQNAVGLGIDVSGVTVKLKDFEKA